MDHATEATRPTVAWYAVAVLMVAYTFSFIDRSIVALLVVPIKRDLGISDTGFSLLGGFAFAIFYTGLGIPIARLADRHSRRFIITAGVLVWSLATTACGMARSFAQLFGARVAVGVGEAALSPAAYSMIADMFSRDSLGKALGVYNTGVFVGAGLALIIGGAVINAVADTSGFVLPLIGEIRGWQLVFFAVGLPGILVALLTATLPEPPRGGLQGSPDYEQPSIGQVLAFLRRNWLTFATHYLGFSSLALLYNSLFFWSPALLIRRFDLAAGDASVYLGFITLLFGTTGIFAGGWLADFMRRRGHSDAAIRTGLLAALLIAPFAIMMPLMPSLTWVLIMYCPLMFCVSMPWAAAATALQLVSPATMRAQVSAVYLFVVNLAGIGFGPTATALVTDYVFGDEAALPYSLVIIGLASTTLGILLLGIGRRPFRLSVAEQDAA